MFFSSVFAVLSLPHGHSPHWVRVFGTRRRPRPLTSLRRQPHLRTLYPTCISGDTDDMATDHQHQRRPLEAAWRKNAEFYQAVRRLVLTDELIELPERFAKFTAEVHDFITRQERFNERVDNASSKNSASSTKSSASSSESSASSTRNSASSTTGLTTASGRASGDNRQARYLHGPNRNFAIGELKGNTARYVVGVLFGEIAEHLGFTFKDTLSRQQLRQMIGPQGRTDVEQRRPPELHPRRPGGPGRRRGRRTPTTLPSKRRTPATPATPPAPGATPSCCNVFAGCPAHAMVASVHNDQDIETEIDAGDVHWYALNPDDFVPD